MKRKRIKMKKNITYILLIFSLIGFSQNKKKEKKPKVAQPEKILIRQGNDFYKQENYVEAEVQYKKA